MISDSRMPSMPHSHHFRSCRQYGQMFRKFVVYVIEQLLCVGKLEV